MNVFLFVFSSLSFFLILGGCGSDDSEEPAGASKEESASPVQPEPETVLSADFEATLANHQAELARLATVQRQLESRLLAEIADKNATIATLEKALAEVRINLADCQESGRKLKVELQDLKSLGAKAYSEIFARAKHCKNEEAIRLYEDFLEQFLTGAVARKAQSRLSHHLRERIILQNRANARALQIWQSRFRASGLAHATDLRVALEQTVGRKPDSAKRAPASEYKQITYVWRDYIADLSGGYRDLVIETIDDKVTKIKAGDKVRK